MLAGRDPGDNPSRSCLIGHPEVWQKDFRFNPREIASALFLRHRLADLEKVAKHHGLTFASHPSTLGQRSGDFRRHVRRAGKKRLELNVVRVDLPAFIATLWKVGGVK